MKLRTVIYQVHACDDAADCRRRPHCEHPAFSGFVETRQATYYLSTYMNRADAEQAAAAIAGRLSA